MQYPLKDLMLKKTVALEQPRVSTLIREVKYLGLAPSEVGAFQPKHKDGLIRLLPRETLRERGLEFHSLTRPQTRV